MVRFYDYMASAQTRLQRAVSGIEDLRFVMDCLKEVKTKDSGIDHEISPILDMYNMLSVYLPDGSVEMVRRLCAGGCVCVCMCGRLRSFALQGELDQMETMRVSWRKVVDIADEVTVRVAKLQVRVFVCVCLCVSCRPGVVV